MGPAGRHDGQDLVVEGVGEPSDVLFHEPAVADLAHLDDVDPGRRADARQPLVDHRVLERGKHPVTSEGCRNKRRSCNIVLFLHEWVGQDPSVNKYTPGYRD